MTLRYFRPASAGALATSCVFLGVAPAVRAAEPASASAFEIEEVVVTALKRTDSTMLQETPLAITVISGDTLVNRGIDNVTDLLRATPGMTVVDQGPGQRRLVVRGIQGAGEAQTGLYYDEAPLSSGAPGTTNDAGQRMPEGRLVDVERIEVLRGPQGTLYGASAVGGAVRVLFNKPSTEAFGAKVTGGIQTTKDGEVGYEANGMANVPINEQLAVRAVGFHRDYGGYIDNVTLHRDDVNDSEASGGRILARYAPSDSLTLDLGVHSHREDSFVSVWELPAGDYRTLVPTQLPTQDDFELYNATLKWDLGFATLTGVTSVFNRDLVVTIDGTRFIKSLPAAIQPPVKESIIQQPQDLEDRSHELRLSSNGDGPLVWTVGGYFEKRNAFTDSRHLFVNPATGLPSNPPQELFHRTIDDTLEQRAVFGEASYGFTEAVTLTLGARYFDYEREFTGETLRGFIGFGFPSVSPPQTHKFDEDGVVSKVNVAYQLSESMLIYAQANQGFRPGGLNDVAGLNETLVPYESDSTWNYELGLKSTWLDNRATLNLAAFRIDWSDMQVTGQSKTGAVRFIVNAGEARVDGFELEAAALLAEGLQVTLAGAYLDAKLTADQVSDQTLTAGRKGDRVPNVPEYSGTLAVEHGRPLGATLRGSWRADVTYVGESFSEFRPDSPFFERIPDYTLTNLRLRLERAGDWNVDLFVSNVFDEVAISRVLSSRFGSDLAVSAPPRTIGMSIAKTF